MFQFGNFIPIIHVDADLWPSWAAEGMSEWLAGNGINSPIQKEAHKFGIARLANIFKTNFVRVCPMLHKEFYQFKFVVPNCPTQQMIFFVLIGFSAQQNFYHAVKSG